MRTKRGRRAKLLGKQRPATRCSDLVHPARGTVRSVLGFVSACLAFGLVAADLDPSFRPNLITPEERAWLAAHPTIRVAPTSDYRPVEFHDAEGRYWGMTSEYFNLIEQRLGFKFQFVRLSATQWEQLDPASRGADVITASAATPQRGQYWSYTKPYLTFPTYIITRRMADGELTLDQLAGARVAVVKGWAVQEFLQTQHPKIIVDAVPDAVTGLRKVSFGLVDAFVSELPVASAAIDREGIANLKIAGEAGFSYRLAISVRKDWPELREILEKALASITPSERDLIYRRWMKMTDPPGWLNVRVRRQLLWGGAVVLSLLVGVLLWNRSLASNVRRRTAELDAELARRLEASQALRESEQEAQEMLKRFQMVARATNDAVWDWDLESKSIWWYNGFQVLFGYRQDELESGIESWISRLHPEDRERTSAGIYAVINGDGAIWSDEYRFRRKDGSYADVFDRGYLIRDSQGRATRMIGAMQDISDRKRAQAALLASEERFAKSFRSSPIAMCVSTVAEGRLLDVNAAFLRMHGLTRGEEVIGKTSIELGLWYESGARDQFVTQLRNEGRILNLKRGFRRMSGEIGVGLYSVELIDLGGIPCAILLINDITEREQAEQALRVSEEKFERAFRDSPDPILIASLPAGRIADANEGACRLAGYSREEMVGRTTLDLKLWRSLEVRERYLTRLKEQGRVRDFEAEWVVRDGSVRLLLVSGEAINLHDGLHVISALRDITDRKRAELERQQLFVQLFRAEDEERRRIARELHDTTAQHLAAVQMNLTRWRDAEPTGRAAPWLTDSLALIGQSVQELRTLTYLLHPPLLEELGLAGALSDYAAGFSTRSGIRVEVNVGSYSGRLAPEQELALFRVAQESLTNVRRHSGSASATIRLERDVEEVRLEVQDSGRGLPANTPMGVGLRGMKERLHQIGGELEIESDSEGTTVLASLPLGVGDEASKSVPMP